MNSLKIKKNDTVVVLSGKDKGKQGKVLGTIPSESKVVVEGINMVTCHIKPRRQGEEGGIVKREAAIYASKVQVVCPKCGKATRVAHKIEDGKKSRICKKCGAEL
jgi:large subunit ribosomal protein L24